MTTVVLDEKPVLCLKHRRLRQKEFYFHQGIPAKKDLIFADKTGELCLKTDTYQRSNRISDRAGLPHIENHSLRHTYATMLFESGVAAKEVQARLGHANSAVTQDNYTHQQRTLRKRL